MKIVYGDKERDTLKHIYDEFSNANLFDDSDPDRVYSLNFKVTDPSVAQYILRGLLFDNLEDFDMGIQVTSINLVPYISNEELKQKLHMAIDDALR